MEQRNRNEVSDARARAAMLPTVSEHAMRLGATEEQVLAVRETTPGTRAALSVLGRITSTLGCLIEPGSPLAAWCENTVSDPAWRLDAPGHGPLWQELQMLQAVSEPSAEPDPYLALLSLRAAYETMPGS